MSDKLDISLEAAMRRYVEQSDESPLAIWSQNGVIKILLRERGFPDWTELPGT